MSNSYFNKPTDIEPHTRALHTSINLLSQATDQAFDKIDIEAGNLPDQTGNDGKFLSTDGTTPSWKNLVQVQELIGDGSTTIDWNLGIKCHFTLGAQDETFTFTAPSSPCNLLLKIKQDSVGGRKCFFPSTVKWLSGEPSWSAGQADKTIIVAMYFDGVYYWGQATPWEV